MKKNFAKDDINIVYSQIGGGHPGHDCFIFRRESYPKYVIGTMCIGIPHIGRILIVNFDGVDKECTFFHEFHTTFHVGNDGQWARDRKNNVAAYRPYQAHNQKLLQNACTKLNVKKRVR